MNERPVVLVTGGARRLGRAMVLELARHGWDVAVHFHASAADAQATVAAAIEAGARSAAFAADLADEAATHALVPAVATRLGRLDAVVNNASRFDYDDAASFSYAALTWHVLANTAPAVVLAQGLHDHLAQRDTAATGCVVNLLDQKLANPNPDYLSYTLSKAALQEASTLLAMALAPRVRVCAVAPGTTLVSGTMSDDEFRRAHAMTPLQRASTPDDVARAVRFVLESPAITGSTVWVDGGQHLAPQPRDVQFLVRAP